MDIDKEKIKKRFSEINKALKEINNISALPDKKVLDFARKDIGDFKDFIKLIDEQFLKQI